MRIQIRYQLHDEPTPREFELSPEEYFDPLEPDEELSVRCVPRLNDTYLYTPYSADDICWTIVEITDGEEFWKVRTQLLDGMRSLMHHTEESDGSEEIISSTELYPGCWHILRTLKAPGRSWALVTNTLTVERPGRLAKDQDFGGRVSYENRKAFGEVV
jgi:hypothetical protein